MSANQQVSDLAPAGQPTRARYKDHDYPKAALWFGTGRQPAATGQPVTLSLGGWGLVGVTFTDGRRDNVDQLKLMWLIPDPATTATAARARAAVVAAERARAKTQEQIRARVRRLNEMVADPRSRQAARVIWVAQAEALSWAAGDVEADDMGLMAQLDGVNELIEGRATELPCCDQYGVGDHDSTEHGAA